MFLFCEDAMRTIFCILKIIVRMFFYCGQILAFSLKLSALISFFKLLISHFTDIKTLIAFVFRILSCYICYYPRVRSVICFKGVYLRTNQTRKYIIVRKIIICGQNQLFQLLLSACKTMCKSYSVY